MLALHVEHGAVDADSGNVLDGALTFRDMLVQEVVGFHMTMLYVFIIISLSI